MKYLCCLLEEPSAEAALSVLINRLFPEFYNFKILPFNGKQDLERNLARKIQTWNIPNTVFLVMRDQDSGDCINIKSRLFEVIRKTGKESNALIRIACHELESFYLGDLEAVEKGLDIDLKANNLQNKEKFRNPDRLNNPAQILKELTQFKYNKIRSSGNIAEYLKLDGSNKSHSFNCLISGLKRIVETEEM